MSALPRSALFSIVLVGGAASVAQVVILRELLVLFLGNELSTGIIFTCWLLWTALGSAMGGRISRRLSLGMTALSGSLCLLALSLPATLVWIRASRIIWGVGKGEMLHPGIMVAAAVSATAFFCLASGFAFGLAWTITSRSHEADATVIYVGEASGAALGGCLFYLFLLSRFSTLTAAWSASVGLAMGGVWVSQRGLNRSGKYLVNLGVAVLTAFCLGSALPLLERLDVETRRWQWEEGIVEARDTPFHNLTLMKSGEQFSLFANGQWLFSVPDPQTTEFAVHPPLLHHPGPESVLLIGGGTAGSIREILKHPTVRRLDYIEPDEEIIRLGQAFGFFRRLTGDSEPRLRVFALDAGAFTRSARESYDVILSSTGDPLNADMNRFYTREFMETLKRLLRPGGLFSFAVSSSPDMVGVVQARFLRSLQTTVRSVFAHSVAYPGENARFVASDEPGSVHVEPAELARRLKERDLQTTHLQENALLDRFSPMRITLLEAVLNAVEIEDLPPNQDFNPTCYFHALTMWGAQAHPFLERLLSGALALKGFRFWGPLTGVLALVIAFFAMGSPKPKLAVGLCVTLTGGVLMVLEVLLLIAFQILEGFVYRELALLIACFMTGLALGSALNRRLRDWSSEGGKKRNGREGRDFSAPSVCGRIAGRRSAATVRLLGVQILTGVYLLGVLGILLLLHRLRIHGIWPRFPVNGVFAVMALAAGILGGVHFGSAVHALEWIEGQRGEGGPGLYGLDLLGAACGAFLASLYFLPVHGIGGTLAALSLLTLSTALTLLRGSSCLKPQ